MPRSQWSARGAIDLAVPCPYCAPLNTGSVELSLVAYRHFGNSYCSGKVCEGQQPEHYSIKYVMNGFLWDWTHFLNSFRKAGE